MMSPAFVFHSIACCCLSAVADRTPVLKEEKQQGKEAMSFGAVPWCVRHAPEQRERIFKTK